MARAIRCTVLETPAMSDSFHSQNRREFRDLVPWADPYIAALIEKLRRSDVSEDPADDPDCPAPSSARGHRREPHWAPRNWPRD